MPRNKMLVFRRTATLVVCGGWHKPEDDMVVRKKHPPAGKAKGGTRKAVKAKPPAKPKAIATEPAGERQTGEISGVVVKVEEVRAEGVLRLALTITTEGGVQETYIAGPANAQAYALVGSLKTGEKVRLAWVTEGTTSKWIRSIRRLEGDGGRTGELNGVVVGVEAVRAEGVLRLALTITTESGVQETYIVGPANAQAYALVGSLKTGENVRLAWVTEGGTSKWIRNIRRLESAQGERTATERKEAKDRGPDAPREQRTEPRK